jgi:hypothetical protein
MERQDLSKLILERLSAAANRDDLIRDVCIRRGITWPEAEAMVNEVEAENERTILRRQSPINLIGSLMYSLAGMMITGAVTLALFWPAIETRSFSFPIFFYLMRYGYKGALMLLAGVAMAVGGMISFFDTIFQLNEK